MVASLFSLCELCRTKCRGVKPTGSPSTAALSTEYEIFILKIIKANPVLDTIMRLQITGTQPTGDCHQPGGTVYAVITLHQACGYLPSHRLVGDSTCEQFAQSHRDPFLGDSGIAVRLFSYFLW